MRDQDGSSSYRATSEMQTLEAGRGTLSITFALALDGDSAHQYAVSVFSPKLVHDGAREIPPYRAYSQPWNQQEMPLQLSVLRPFRIQGLFNT
jgi:hypothetical protein